MGQRGVITCQNLQSCLLVDLGLESNPTFSFYLKHSLGNTDYIYTLGNTKKIFFCYIACLEMYLNNAHRYKVMVKSHFLSSFIVCLILSPWSQIFQFLLSQ